MSDRIQLYSLATPNGQKVSVALEEMEIPYDAHRIDIFKKEQFSEAFISINPNSKIPALVDPVGDEGKPLAIMESGAILMYLAEVSGKFLPPGGAKRSQVMQWLFFQMGGVGPMFGQFGHFYKYAAETCEHPYPTERYSNEVQRLLAVMESQLAKTAFIAGDEISIADFSIFPWVVCLEKYYSGKEKLGLHRFEKVNTWVDTCMQRPAVQRGMVVCPV